MSRPTRRPPIIGPFFAIALVLGAGIFVWQKHQNARALQSAPPPVIEHQVVATPGDDVGPPPTFVLADAKGLQLTPAQMVQVTRLASDYVNETGPLLRQTQAAVNELGDRWGKADPRHPVSTQEMQTQAEALGSLNSRLLDVRRSYWHKLAAVLTEEQQTHARDLWAQSLKGGHTDRPDRAQP